MLQDLLAVLLSGVAGAANQIVSDQKTNQALASEQQEKAQSFQNDINKGIALEAIKGNIKGKNLSIDPSTLSSTSPDWLFNVLNSIKPKKISSGLGRGVFNRTPSTSVGSPNRIIIQR